MNQANFRKMNGLGNDFVVLDGRVRPLALGTEAVKAIADRQAGIGCDQLIALEPSTKADVFMRIWNADGGEVAACGNAARCVAALLAEERGRSDVTVETEAGVLDATVNTDGTVTVDMGARDSIGRTFRSRSRSPIRAISSCRSGRSMRRCCIRRRWSMSAIRIASSLSTMSRLTISRGSGRCWSIIRCSPSAPIFRWRR